MLLEEIFKRLGLPKHSAKIYSLLARKGPLLASHISREISVHRPAVYRALEALKKHQFIFVSLQSGKKYYHSANSTIISREFSKTSKTVSEKLAKKEIGKEKYLHREIRFLTGFPGIRAAFDDVISHLPKGGTFYRYTSEKDLDAVNRYLSKDYRSRRDAKKLERLVISNPLSGKRKRPRLERFVKFIPPEFDLFDQNIIHLVYGSRLSFIDLSTERVLIIENKAMADFQKVIFQQLYRKLPG